MKVFLLSMLSTVLLSVLSAVARAEAGDICEPPAPFQLLTKNAVAPFRLTAILPQTTRSRHPTRRKEPTVHSPNRPQQVHIVNFWAAWCAPCREELPLLDKLSAEKAAAVTLINVGDSRETAEKILQELNVTQLNTRLADGEILSTLSIAGLPASLLFAEEQVYLGMGKLKNAQAINHWLRCLSKPHSL